MKKATKKSVSINNLVSKLDVNLREENNYDIPQMKEQIVTVGRILKPLSVEEMPDKKGYYLILQGNRRTLAAQELHSDPACPSDLKEALDKIDVMVYEDLTPIEREMMIADHGGEKPLSRSEIVKTVWRLDKMFMDESMIASILYFELADFTGNRAKLQDVPTEPKARAKYVKQWFHGTLGNFMLAASRMGEFVREQFMLTHRSQDKLLKEGESVTMKCDRVRINALSTAITADRTGKGWTDLTILPSGDKYGGGEKFNEMIDKFIAEDKNGKEDGPKRLTVKDLKDRVGLYKSVAIKTALTLAAGEEVGENGKKLLELDNDHWALQLKCEVLHKHLNTIKDPQVYALVESLLKGPAGGVEVALKPYIN